MYGMSELLITMILPSQYPFEKICGATVAYKLIQALYEKRGLEHDFYLEYLAIATVCDVVDLTDENRIIVKHGLASLVDTKNKGLCALIEQSFSERKSAQRKNITAASIGFGLAPRIS